CPYCVLIWVFFSLKGKSKASKQHAWPVLCFFLNFFMSLWSQMKPVLLSFSVSVRSEQSCFTPPSPPHTHTCTHTHTHTHTHRHLAINLVSLQARQSGLVRYGAALPHHGVPFS